MKLSDRTYTVLDRMFGDPDLKPFFASVDGVGSDPFDELTAAFAERNLDLIAIALQGCSESTELSDPVYQALRLTDGAIGTLLNLDEYCAALVGKNPFFDNYLSLAQKKREPMLIDDASVEALSALNVPIGVPTDGPHVPCVPFLMVQSAQYLPVLSGDASSGVKFDPKAFSNVNKAGVFNGRRLAVRSDAQAVLERAAASSARMFSASAVRGSLLPAFNGYLTEELNK